MKRYFILIVIGYMFPTHAFAEVLFDVDFETPSFTNGQTIIGGTAPFTPTDAYLGIISNSVPGFSSQSAVLYADYAGGGIKFETSVYSSGVHNISWEMVNVSSKFDGAVYFYDINQAFSFSSGTPMAFQMWNIITNDPPSYPPTRYPIIENTANVFRMVIDLDNNDLSFFFNGDALVGHYLIGEELTLNQVSFWQNTSIGAEGVRYAIDNFRWEVVDHPRILPPTVGNISWSSESGKTYRVQSTSDLVDGTWSNITTGINATSELTTIPCPTSGIPFEALRTILENE